MVFHQRAEAETCIQSCVPGLAVVRFDVRFDCATERGKWLLHVVVVAVDVGKCRYFWSYLRLAEKI